MRQTSILFVCLGNICRSAAAEAIMKAVADKAGIGNFLSIDSAGILNVHEGQPADLRMRQAAKAHGYDVCSISRPVTLADFDKFDLIIGMDNSNIDDLKDKALTQEHIDKIHAMREFFTKYTDDYIPDPYYGGAAGFELVIALLEDACGGLTEKLKKEIEKNNIE